jgi:hypothetical protein
MSDTPSSPLPAAAAPITPDVPGLDQALERALLPPPLPPGFHAALERRIAQEQAQDLAARQRALAVEHAQEMARLRAGTLSLRRDTLLTIIAGAFSVGAAASVGLPSLARFLGTDVLTVVTLGASAGALVLAAAVVWRKSGFGFRG